MKCCTPCKLFSIPPFRMLTLRWALSWMITWTFMQTYLLRNYGFFVFFMLYASLLLVVFKINYLILIKNFCKAEIISSRSFARVYMNNYSVHELNQHVWCIIIKFDGRLNRFKCGMVRGFIISNAFKWFQKNLLHLMKNFHHITSSFFFSSKGNTLRKNWT